jgi:hypothetical protein
MVERSGKFGAFHVCKDHGTISIQGSQVVCTGSIFESLKNQTKKLTVTSGTATQYNGEKPTDLELTVRTQVAAMGLYMDGLDLFVEGGPNAADDEPSHWMNLRPY